MTRSPHGLALKRLARTATPRALRNWVRSPSRSAQWVWDGLRFTFGGTRELEIFPGWRLKCHPRAYRVFLRDQVIDENQAAEFSNFVRHCQKEMLLFDIGAHFGAFSLAAAHAGGRAVAVDPSPDALRIVEIQGKMNDHSPRLTTLRAAVTSRAGSMGLLGSGVFSAGYFKVAPGEPQSELTQISAVSIDDLTERFGPPTHIKIDIEGHEAAALRGAAATLSGCSPLLFLEFHNKMIADAGGDPEAAITELFRAGYSAFSVSGALMQIEDILAPPIARFVARRQFKS